MEFLSGFIRDRLPHPAVKSMADRLFIITLSGLTFTGYFMGLQEGFICGITALLLYLSNIEIGCSRGLMERKGRFIALFFLSVALAALETPYLPILSFLYTFFLVFIERDDYYRGIPMFLTPLAIHLLSIGIPVEGIPLRILSLFIGVLIAFISQRTLWPVARVATVRVEVDRARVRYALRVALGVGIGLVLGNYIGEGLEPWLAYTFIILHLPIDDQILPRVIRRLGGTILGGVLYFIITYGIDSKFAIYVLAAGALYLSFLFIKNCYFTAVTFITLNFLLYSAGRFPFIFLMKQRLVLALLGGGIALIISVLIPMKKPQNI